MFRFKINYNSTHSLHMRILDKISQNVLKSICSQKTPQFNRSPYNVNRKYIICMSLGRYIYRPIHHDIVHLLRSIHHYKIGLNQNMDHTSVSRNAPSSVILTKLK